MKRTNLLALLLLFTTVLNAQAPQRMSFQAVVRDGDGALVTNGTVGMRISVLQGGENGTAVYVETHEPQTNANGLITLEVGGGTVVSGTMDAINWAEGPYHLKTETDGRVREGLTWAVVQHAEEANDDRCPPMPSACLLA